MLTVVLLLLIVVLPLLIVLYLLLIAFTLLLTVSGSLVQVQSCPDNYHTIMLHSCVVTTVFDLLERCVSLVLRLALLGSWHSHYMVATWQSHDLTWELQ